MKRNRALGDEVKSMEKGGREMEGEREEKWRKGDGKWGEIRRGRNQVLESSTLESDKPVQIFDL